jgi:hypothetical protein
MSGPGARINAHETVMNNVNFAGSIMNYIPYGGRVVLSEGEEPYRDHIFQFLVYLSLWSRYVLRTTRPPSQNLMIKNQRLYAQRDDTSIHERGADVNVIAFGQTNLVNHQQRA